MLFSSWTTVFAQAEQQQAPSWTMYVPMLIIGFMMIMFLRTSSKQKREMQNAMNSLKKNDKVVTSGGIIGSIASIKENEDEVTLKVDETSNTRIRVLKSSIVKVTSGDQVVGETK